MLSLLGAIGRRIIWFVVSVLVVVAALALTTGLPDKITTARKEAVNLEAVARALSEETPTFEKDARGQVQEADRRISQLRAAGLQGLGEAERKIDGERKQAQKRILNGGGIWRAALKGDSEKIVASYRAEYVDVPLADRAKALIGLRRQNLQKVANRNKQIKSLEERIDKQNGNVDRYNERVAKRNRLQREAVAQRRNPLCLTVAVPLACKKVRQVRTLDADLPGKRRSLEAEALSLEAEKAAIKAIALAKESVADGAQLAKDAVKAFDEESGRIAKHASDRVWNISKAALQRYGLNAVVLVLSAILLPLFFKLFAFLIIAPMASRARPVRVIAPGTPLQFGGSRTAIDVPLDRNTEVYLRSGVQSAASDIQGSDVPLLGGLIAFTTGLTGLQRLRSDRPDHVTVTAINDEHFEVALLEIPSGGAVALQTRALVGLVKRRDQKLRVKRHWRIHYLTSWLTGRFRYVVFHGPCSLIVQGRRGLAVEEAARGRMINKRLVIGFDAGLLYGAARSESFWPYWRGEQSLYKDRFAGEGRYLYEQRPAVSGRGVLWGRGLAGLGDAAQTAVGL